MRTCIAALAALSLTACASTQAVMDKEPTMSGYSKKSFAETVFCFAQKYDVPAYDGPNGEKVILLKNIAGATGSAISISETPEGVLVEERRGYGGGIGFWKTCMGLKGES